MTARITSIESYKQLVLDKKLGEDQLKVLDAIIRMKNAGFAGASDTEIASELGVGDPVSSKKYRPRRNELVHLGLVQEVGTTECGWTGRRVIQWGLTGVTEVKDMFVRTAEDGSRDTVAQHKDVEKCEDFINKMNLYQVGRILEFAQIRKNFLEREE